LKAPRDFDFVVIGSGFGGSVSAHRLTEKGYRVAVLDMGKRYLPADHPKSDWNLRKFIVKPVRETGWNETGRVTCAARGEDTGLAALEARPRAVGQ
jgi:choline dehydrogenase-like flavoprotein